MEASAILSYHNIWEAFQDVRKLSLRLITCFSTSEQKMGSSRDKSGSLQGAVWSKTVAFTTAVSTSMNNMQSSTSC